jgi:hypothetical protein
MKLSPKYAKSILACTENKLKEYNENTPRMSSPYIENTTIYIKLRLSLGEFLTHTKKVQIINQLCRYDRMGKKTISRYWPFKYCGILK